MKFTLNDCLSRINVILNYISASYEDTYPYFDQAIAELNTSLRIALPTVSEMVAENTFDICKYANVVNLTNFEPEFAFVDSMQDLNSLDSVIPIPNIAVVGTNLHDSIFAVRTGVNWASEEYWTAKELYGISNPTDLFGDEQYYKVILLPPNTADWAKVTSNLREFDLTDYMPMSWWMLFVIPYVCFKLSVRNGDSGNLFVDEFTQGFQQLQSSYAVPSSVVLSTVAGLPAYTNIVQNNVANLNAVVPTRAITEAMRVGIGIQSVFGGFYETGGWGI